MMARLTLPMLNTSPIGRTLLEILFKWSSDLPEEELEGGKRQLSLELLKHEFPYELTPFRWVNQSISLELL